MHAKLLIIIFYILVLKLLIQNIAPPHLFYAINLRSIDQASQPISVSYYYQGLR